MSATIIDEAKAVFAAAGLDTALAAAGPGQFAVRAACLCVAVGEGHITLSLVLWPTCTWSCGVTTYDPMFGHRGIPSGTAKTMPKPKAALASTLTWALGQAWPTEAESAAMLGMLTRLRESEASK